MYSDNITQKIAEAAKKIMDEQLKGNQHKIDANKNGKIDAEDFKLLKAKKEVKQEEVEQIDELSKKTLGNYIKRNADDQARIGYINAAAQHDKTTDRETKNKILDKNERQGINRDIGLERAVKKLTKEEQEFIDELNKGTLGSYVNAAARDAVHRTAKEVETGRLDKLADKRMKGIKLATKKLAKEETDQVEEGYYKDIDTNRKEDERLAALKKKETPFTPDKPAKKVATAGKFGYGYSAARHLARQGMASVTKEEVERIDEISKDTLRSYVGKAEDDVLQKHKAVSNTPGSSPSLKHARKMDMYKRMGNITKAYKKITKEETEQVDEAITKTSTGYIHHARPGVYGGSAPEKHVVDTLRGPKKSEIEAIEKEKKMKKFSEMLDLINSQGLKALSEMINEEPDNEQFTKELKDQQAKMDGKKKGGEVAKGDVQAVKVEEVQVEVFDANEINGVEEVTIDERHLTEPETKKKEEIVKSMKKGLAGFKARYGDRAKEVMYATATKQAKGE